MRFGCALDNGTTEAVFTDYVDLPPRPSGIAHVKRMREGGGGGGQIDIR